MTDLTARPSLPASWTWLRRTTVSAADGLVATPVHVTTLIALSQVPCRPGRLLRSLRAHRSGLDEAALNGLFQMSGSPAASVIIINAEDEMATGTVKWFNQEKRFGFITPDVAGQDLFVHQTGLAGGAHSLMEGSNVEFDAED